MSSYRGFVILLQTNYYLVWFHNCKLTSTGFSCTVRAYLKNSWLAVEEKLLLVAMLVQLGVFQVLLQFCQGNGAWKELKR